MQLNSKKIQGVAIVVCVILGVFMSIELGLSVNKIKSEASSVADFLNDEGMIQYVENIPTRDGSHIAAYVYMPESKNHYDNHSVPAIIYCPGANSLKERHFEKHFQLVKMGYAVIAVEQRGHGESGRFFSFYQQEPYDISDVMDYISLNYLQINTTHFGLVGMSLGGGTSVAVQALDDRIHASVIYHPLCNVSDYFYRLGVDLLSLLGYPPGMSPPYPLDFSFQDWDEIFNQTLYESSTINLVNETNTKNLLLLHGTEDNEVHPSNSEELVSIADPTDSRDDVQLIIRDGLGHGGNEGDETSFRYQICWFNHFFMNNSIDLDDLETETTFVNFADYSFLQTGNYESHIENFVVLMISFLFILLYVIMNPLTVDDLKNIFKEEYLIEESDEKSIILMRSGIIIGSFLVSSIYCSMYNPSFLYGIFLYPVLISTPLLLMLPVKGLRSRFETIINPKSFNYYLNAVIVFAVPFLFRLILFNYAGARVMEEVHAPEPLIFMYYVGLFSGLLLTPFLFMNGFKFKRFWIIPLLYLICGYIFIAFIPLGQIPLLPIDNLSLFLPVLLAVIMVIGYVIIKLISNLVTRNIIATLNIIGVVASVFLLMRVFRLI